MADTPSNTDDAKGRVKEAAGKTLLAREDDEAAAELADRFGASLEFGTAGLRGRLGAGPNRMNRVVVQRAAGPQPIRVVALDLLRGVVVGHGQQAGVPLVRHAVESGPTDQWWREVPWEPVSTSPAVGRSRAVQAHTGSPPAPGERTKAALRCPCDPGARVHGQGRRRHRRGYILLMRYSSAHGLFPRDTRQRTHY